MIYRKSNCYVVLSAQAFAPYDELERAVTALQEQLVNRRGLIGYLEVEPTQGYAASFVGQDGRQVVKVERGLARCVIGSVIAEGLVAAFVHAITQQIDGRIGIA